MREKVIKDKQTRTEQLSGSLIKLINNKVTLQVQVLAYTLEEPATLLE